jgi:hypothetical protein
LLPFAPPRLSFIPTPLEIARHVESGIVDDAAFVLDGQKAPVIVDGVSSLPLSPAGLDVLDDNASVVTVAIVVYPGPHIRDLELTGFCFQALT